MDDRNEADRILGEDWMDPRHVRLVEALEAHADRGLIVQLEQETDEHGERRWSLCRQLEDDGWVEVWLRPWPLDRPEERPPIRVGAWPLKIETDALELRAREPDEYLLHPMWSPKRPFDPSALHLHFKKWLERAGLPATIKMHELRHAAADNLWRETGNLLLAQQLLRHESVATTQGYLHPSHDDLAQALTRLQVVKPEPDA